MAGKGKTIGKGEQALGASEEGDVPEAERLAIVYRESIHHHIEYLLHIISKGQYKNWQCRLGPTLQDIYQAVERFNPFGLNENGIDALVNQAVDAGLIKAKERKGTLIYIMGRPGQNYVTLSELMRNEVYSLLFGGNSALLNEKQAV